MKKITFILLALCVAGAIVIDCNDDDSEAAIIGTSNSSTNSGQEIVTSTQSKEEYISPEDITPVLDGFWGRVTTGASWGGVFAKGHYSSIRFFPDNTLLYEGVSMFKRYRAKGKYQLSADETRVTWEITEVTEPIDDPEIRTFLGLFEGEFRVHRSTDRRMIVSSGGFEYVEGLWYDWQSDCYRDEEGSGYIASNSNRSVYPVSNMKDEVYRLFPHEEPGNGFNLKADLDVTRKKITKIYIIPKTRWSSPGDDDYQSEEDLVVSFAKNWLKEHVIPSSIPVEIRRE